MKLLKIDEHGFFIEDVIVTEIPMVTQEDEEGNSILVADPSYIQTPCQGGLYLPQWNGTEWIEGKSPEEIQGILNTPQPKTQLEIMQEIIDQLLIDSLGGV